MCEIIIHQVYKGYSTNYELLSTDYYYFIHVFFFHRITHHSRFLYAAILYPPFWIYIFIIIPAARGILYPTPIIYSITIPATRGILHSTPITCTITILVVKWILHPTSLICTITILAAWRILHPTPITCTTNILAAYGILHLISSTCSITIPHVSSLSQHFAHEKQYYHALDDHKEQE